MNTIEDYQHIIRKAAFGFAYHEIILDDLGKPCDYRFIEVNEAFGLLTGIGTAQLTGRRVTEVIPGIENDGMDWIGYYGKIALEGGESDFEHYSAALNKYYQVQVFSDRKGFFTTIITDITKKKQTETNLQLSEDQLRTYLATAPLGILYTDRAGRYLEANQEICRMTGYSVTELLEMCIRDLVDPSYASQGLAYFEQIQVAGSASNEIAYRTKSGEKRWWNIVATRITEDRYLGFHEDITGRKVVEDQLKDTQAALKAIVENTRDGIWSINTRYEITYVNEVVARDFRTVFGTELHPGSNAVESLPAALQKLWKERYDRVLGGDRFVVEDQVKVEDKERFVEVALTPIITDEKVTGASIFGRDITARKNAERSLLVSEELNRRLLATIPDIVIRTDLGGNITFLNESVLKDYPYLSPADLIGRNMLSFFTGEDLQRATENTRLMFERPLGVVEYTLQLDKMHRIICDVNGDVIRDTANNPTGMVYMIRDITKRKQAELEVSKSEIRARQQRAAIAELVLNPFFAPGEITGAFRRVTEVLSETLGVARTSIWILAGEDRELCCRMLYEAEGMTYSSGDTLRATEYPAYFKAIMTENRINAEDARHDPRTCEFADTYLPSLGITSMLDAGIFMEGKLVGVLCCEHTGEQRKWYPDEESFISTVASIVAQLLINAGRREAETALQESNKRYLELSTLLRLMTDNMPDMLWAKNLDKEYIFANKALCEILLHARDTSEPLGKTTLFFATRERAAHPENPQWHTFGEIGHDSDDPVPENLEPMQLYEQGYADGKFLILDVHKAPLYDEQGKLIGVVGSARDVTKAKETENQLRKLSQAVEQSPASVVITNTVGDIEYVNPKFTEITGYALAEILGKNPRILKSGAHDQSLYREMWNTILSGHEWRGEFQNRKKNGELFWESASISPIKNETGEIIHFLAVKEDITALKLQADKIRESEEQHRTLIVQMQEGLVAGDQFGLIRYVNPMFCKMTGYEEHELIGNSGYELMLSENETERMKDRDENRKRNLCDDYELEITTKSGDKKTLWFHASSTSDENGVFTGSLSTVTDITEKKQLEKELRHQTHLRELLMEITSDFINIPLERVDASVNDALRKMALFVNADRSYTFDYDWEKQVCNNIYEWCAGGISPEIGNLQKVPLNMMPDWVQAHQQGDPIYVPDVDSLPRGAVRDILEPQGIKSVVAVPMMNGGTCIGFVGFDSVNHHHNYSHTELQLLRIFAQALANVKMRKEMLQELIAAKEKAEESNRLKTAFLQNLSHEVRTPLNGIIGFSDLLQDPEITDKERTAYTNIVIQRGWQLTSIINDILTISSLETKQENLFNEDFNVNTLLRNQLALFKDQALARGLQFTLDSLPADSNAEVTADKTKLNQVLNNLITNAFKFTKCGSIELGCRQKGEWLEFFVKDTGIGIDQSKLEMIFDRFTQADDHIRGNFGGTGLGLSICKGFVELMGGTIRVESTPGLGSVFSFTLPYEPSHLAKAPVPAEPESHRADRQVTILVAEDEEYNFMYLETLLTRLDVRVLHAANGQEAIDFCHSEKVDLVLMDIKMPVMNGHDAAIRIKKAFPDLPIVAQTAHAVQSEIARYGDAFDDYITKPFTKDKLSLITGRFIKR